MVSHAAVKIANNLQTKLLAPRLNPATVAAKTDDTTFVALRFLIMH